MTDVQPVPGADRDAPAGLTVGRLVRTLVRQWFVIPVCMIVAVAGSLAYAKLTPSHYQAYMGVNLGSPPPGSTSQTSTPTASPTLPDPNAEVESASVVQAAAAAAHTTPQGISLTISYVPTTSGSSSASLGPTGDATIAATAATPLAAEEAAAAAGPAFVAQRTADIRGEVSTQIQQLDQIQSRLKSLQGGQQSTGPIGSLTYNPSGPLGTQIAVINSMYQELYGSTVQLQVLAGSVGVTHSVTAAQRVGLSTSKRAAEAAAAGLLVGLGLVLLRDRLMDRGTDPFEIRGLASLPVLGTLPKLRRRSGATLVEGGQGPLAESYRAIRTALLLQAPARQKVLLVVSAGRREGRTSVAANLAAAFARTGAPTLLLGADFRHPDTAAPFGLAGNRKGLADILRAGRGRSGAVTPPDGGAQLPDGIFSPTDIPNLDVLPAGQVGADSPELLGAEALEKLDWALRQRFEVIVVDTPAVTEASDAVALSTHADGCVFVFARNRSTKRGVSKSLDALRHTPARVLGIVVTHKGSLRPSPSVGGGDRSVGLGEASDRASHHGRRSRRDR